jgi:prolipoprotein diacylglyceryl transferase
LIASIPSPGQAVWHIGPIPIRAYAMCILAGIVVAVWITQRRLNDRGGKPGQALDVAVWAVPFGIVGARIYHVVTDPELYFAAGRNPWNALAIWNGGLGIWGAVAMGIVGAWIGCRRNGVRLLDYGDAAAPGIVLAQAMGRWGNYFNQELFGGPTSLPWGLEISPANRPPGYTQYATFQPTFLYESLWCVLVAVVLVLVDRRFSLARGQIFALYGMLYTIGRGLIELLRTDHANHILGLRLNVWTSVVVFAGSTFAFWYFGHRGRAGQELSGAAESAPDEPVPDEPVGGSPQPSQYSD